MECPGKTLGCKYRLNGMENKSKINVINGMYSKSDPRWHPTAPQMRENVVDIDKLQSWVKPWKFDAAERMKKKPTEAERVLKARIAHSRLRNWHCMDQVVMIGYILDFFFPTIGLCVEVDGGYHRSPEQIESDAIRDKALLRQGVTTIRLTNERVLANPCQAVKVIRVTAFHMATEIFTRRKCEVG
jgi:very-short-patch-repair endonuclease